MRSVVFGLTAALTLFATIGSGMAQQYNTVPGGDAQYARCLSFALSKYSGGGEASRVPGQTKAEAWCTCMWNETPDNFGGDLVAFSESSQGAAMNRTCERYSGWES